ncbi:MAG: hypothetical protein AAFN27_05100 [Pseudomonadota bacterium]
MRVLILEDDASLLLAFTQALEDDGHIVLACAREDEAMNYLRYQGSTINLIVLDLFIGSRPSLSVASFAAYAAPDAEVIVVTGSDFYPNGELHEMGHNVSWSLRKPVRMNDLQALAQFTERRCSDGARSP